MERALFDEMRVADNLREAVVSIDMAAAAGLTTILRMQRYVAGHAGRAGAPVVRRALVLADEMSRSPNETRMRLIWVLDARLPAPRCNIEVFDADGSFIGVADLLDEQGGVVGEFDGADHRGARRHARDVAREDRFRGAGLEYFKVTGLDIDDHRLVRDRMVAARERAEALRGRGSWTARRPEAPSLDAVLDERDAVRALHELRDRPGVPHPPALPAG